uniref:Uncharacterized protein n=1 Tax=Arundo donax TaxID=35708 RepID=A0A0A9CPU3_ARUDO
MTWGVHTIFLNAITPIIIFLSFKNLLRQAKSATMLYHHLYLGKQAIRSAKRGREPACRRNLWGDASPRESRAGGGEKRSPAAVGRAEGDRRVEGKGIAGGGTATGRGERIYRLELFLEREEWW